MNIFHHICILLTWLIFSVGILNIATHYLKLICDALFEYLIFLHIYLWISIAIINIQMNLLTLLLTWAKQCLYKIVICLSLVTVKHSQRNCNILTHRKYKVSHAGRQVTTCVSWGWRDAGPRRDASVRALPPPQRRLHPPPTPHHHQHQHYSRAVSGRLVSDCTCTHLWCC